jgi:two-component system, NtrC family, sensor kinase
MKKFIAIVIVLFKVITGNTQATLNTDSLKRLMTVAKEDTTRIILLAKLCNELARFAPDSAIKLGQEGLKLAKQIHYLKGEVYLTRSLGVAWYSIGEYSIAIKLYLSKLKYIDTTKDMEIKRLYNAELTIAYRDQRDYTEALKYVNKNLDAVYKFLQYSPRDSCTFCTGCFLLMASIYLEMHQTDSAQKYVYEAFSYPMTNMKGIEANLYAVAGRLYTELKNYDTALQLHRQSVQRFLQLKYPYRALAEAYNNMAVVFDALDLRDSAFFYLYKSLAVSKPKNFVKQLLETYLILSKMHESYNNDSALYYHKQAMLAKDFLFNQKAQRLIASYKFDLEFQEQEVENAEAQLRSKIKIYALLGAALFFFTIGLILLRNNDRRKKALALLKKQKSETDRQKSKAEQAFEELKSAQA